MARGTTKRNIRISDELWQRALHGTAERGSNVAEFIRGKLEEAFGDAELSASLIVKEDRVQVEVAEMPHQQRGRLTTPQKLKQLRIQLAAEESLIARNAIQKQIELLELMS